MKSSEAKTTHSNPSQAAKGSQSFFSKVGGGSFFSKEAPQTDFFFSPATVQCKLTIGAPNDPYEQEADAMADKIVQRLSVDGGRQTVDAPSVQRKCAACEGEEKLQKMEGEEAEEMLSLQRKAIFESNEEQPPIGTLQSKADTGTSVTSSDLESRLSASRGSGQPLTEGTRNSMESAFGADFSSVRVHTGSEAVQMNKELGAQAFTHGSDVYFGAGKYDPGSSEGQRLLGHELTHVVQQGKTLRASNLLQKTPGDEDEKASYTFKVPKGLKTEEELNQHAEVLIFERVMNKKWKCQTGCEYFQDPAKAAREGISVTYLYEASYVDKHGGKKAGEAITPPSSNPVYNKTKGKKRNDLNKEIDKRYFEGTGTPEGEKIIKGEEAKIEKWNVYRDQVMNEKKKLEQLPTAIKDIIGGEKNFQPQDYKQLVRISEKVKNLDPKDVALLRLQTLTEDLDGLEAVMDKASSGNITSIEDPEELKRLFKIFQDKVTDPQFSESGESWLRFAKFIDKNKDKIEGILKGNPAGKLTQEKIEKIIAEYGKYISAEPIDAETPEKLETIEDFDKQFKYDPGWQKLSKEDRKLLLEYAKANPDEIKEGKVDFSRVTTEMKMSMALKLSDTSLLGEMGEAAKSAFSDPTFIITLILIVAVYVGLWLTPEPTGVTKLAAGILTIVLLAQFAWQDIYGFAKAWFAFSDECSKAKTIDELKNAGDKFLKTIGPIGFDIALMIVMWGAGKAIGPKLSKVGLERASARAETAIKTAEAKPGAGGKTPAAKANSPKLLENGANSPAKSPTEKLNAFESQLSEGAKSGLKSKRAKLPDAKVLEILEGKQERGLDLDHFLTEEGMTPEAKASAQAEVTQAKARLMRLKLLELKVHDDPILRKSAKELRAAYKALGELTDPLQIQAKQSIIENKMIGDLGEAMARSLLKSEYAARGANIQIEANIEAVREVPGYKSKAEWKAAQIESGKAASEIDTGKMREAQGKVWESIVDADALVVEKTQSGKLKIIESEQAKTGANDTGPGAKEQNTNLLKALEAIASGDKSIKLFDKTGEALIGKERTADFELSNLSDIKLTTRGLPNKTGFDKVMPESRPVLQEVAKEILQSGLPSLEFPLPLTNTSPRKEKNE